MSDLRGKRVIISGASSGIGLETARILVQGGAAIAYPQPPPPPPAAPHPPQAPEPPVSEKTLLNTNLSRPTSWT